MGKERGLDGSNDIIVCCMRVVQVWRGQVYRRCSRGLNERKHANALCPVAIIPLTLQQPLETLQSSSKYAFIASF